jgi:hypothetical protein
MDLFAMMTRKGQEKVAAVAEILRPRRGMIAALLAASEIS